MSADFDDGGERDEFGLEPPEDGEPAPQAESTKPSVDHAPVRCRHCVANGYGICRHAQPDPDAAVRATKGDEKQARRVAHEFLNRTFGGCSQAAISESMENWLTTAMVSLCEDAFAAGRALGRDEGAREEREARCRQLRKSALTIKAIALAPDMRVLATVRAEALDEAAGAIARRGKEGING